MKQESIKKNIFESMTQSFDKIHNNIDIYKLSETIHEMIY